MACARLGCRRSDAVVTAGPLSSGHLSIEVAIAIGATELVVLGYDCRTVAGRSHCHDDYPGKWREERYRETLLPM